MVNSWPQLLKVRILTVTILLLFLKAEWALRPKPEWAIDSEAIRARGIIIVFVK